MLEAAGAASIADFLRRFYEANGEAAKAAAAEGEAREYGGDADRMIDRLEAEFGAVNVSNFLVEARVNSGPFRLG